MTDVLIRPTPGSTSGRPPEPTDADAPAVVRGVVRTARPEQWIKNLLVFVAPAVAASLTASVVVGSVVAFAAFTLAAAGTYLLNDVTDRHADARHPRKCNRPVAAGIVPPRTAVAAGVVLVVAGLIVPVVAGTVLLAACVGGYLAANVAYNAGIKHVAFVELAMVCGFYGLRIVGGAVAAGVAVPVEIGITLIATALAMIAGKRYAELRDQGDVGETRQVLRRYSLEQLRSIQLLAGVAAVGAYSLWAFGRTAATGSLLFAASVAPVVIGVCRYASVLAGGRGERPERLVWADRPLLASIVLTAVTFGLGTQGIS